MVFSSRHLGILLILMIFAPGSVGTAGAAEISSPDGSDPQRVHALVDLATRLGAPDLDWPGVDLLSDVRISGDGKKSLDPLPFEIFDFTVTRVVDHVELNGSHWVPVYKTVYPEELPEEHASEHATTQ